MAPHRDSVVSQQYVRSVTKSLFKPLLPSSLDLEMKARLIL